MVERNPLTVDYYIRYQEIIEEYNRGKNEMVIRETFRKLIELINSYSEEEAAYNSLIRHIKPMILI